MLILSMSFHILTRPDTLMDNIRERFLEEKDTGEGFTERIGIPLAAKVGSQWHNDDTT